MRNLLRSIVVCALVLGATPAFGDEFYDEYQRGMTSFKAKDYTTARAEFLRAYDLRPEPIVLFDIAQTYRLDDMPDQALVYYKLFLSESAIAEDLRVEAQGYVDQLEEATKVHEAQQAIDDANGAADDGDRSLRGTESSPAAAPRSERKGTSASRRRIPIASWISAGVGGAGLLSAVVLGTVGLQAEADLHRDPMATQADADRVERYQLATNLSWGVTGAAVIAAAVFYFTAQNDSRDRTTVTVSLMPHSGWAASVSGSF